VGKSYRVPDPGSPDRFDGARGFLAGGGSLEVPEVGPVGLRESAKKGVHLAQYAVDFCIADVFLEAEHLRKRRRVPPSRQDEWQGWLPAGAYAVSFRQEFPQLLPTTWLWTDAVVCPDVLEKLIEHYHTPSPEGGSTMPEGQGTMNAVVGVASSVRGDSACV